MCRFTVLALASDAGWLERLWSSLRGLPGSRVVAASTTEEATEVLECLEPRVVVIDGNPGAITDEQIDQLLWANSTLPRPVAVVVAGEEYDPQRALSLFRMGVDDYLGGDDHWSRLLQIFDQLLGLDSAAHLPPELFQFSEAGNPSQLRPQGPLRWVTAETA
ncbi:MAG: hypothetical protein U0790_23235 [Isosphaeraceae bacterium]